MCFHFTQICVTRFITSQDVCFISLAAILARNSWVNIGVYNHTDQACVPFSPVKKSKGSGVLLDRLCHTKWNSAALNCITCTCISYMTVVKTINIISEDVKLINSFRKCIKVFSPNVTAEIVKFTIVFIVYLFDEMILWHGFPKRVIMQLQHKMFSDLN